MGVYDVSGFGELFNTVKVTESKPEPYLVIEGFLRGDREGNPPQSVRSASIWYLHKYKEVYGEQPIGYNHHNFRKVCTDIMEVYNFSCWELVKQIDKWFTTFDSLGWNTVTWDGKLTPAVLKLGWVVKALVNDEPPTTNRNSSYKQHSSSRRASTKEERAEVDYTISY